MSKKKKKQRAEEIQAIKQEIPIQNDPYWKVSSIYMDPHRVGRFCSKFELFEDMHPEWTDDLMNGMPTYYCILGVERGATKDQIEQAYERKLKFSSYPDEVIEEAFDALSNPRLQKEYDELLFTFEQITKSMPLHEKNELVKKHSTCISIEKEYIRMGQILSRYKDYTVLYKHGMPDLYEIAGLVKDSTTEEIRRNCRADSELLKKICAVLTDPASREEYDFMLGFIAKHIDRELLEERERSRKKWKHMDRGIFEKIILTSLNEPDVIEKYMQRQVEILNNNQDWKQYLPPNKETFLTMLGLDARSLRADKKEVERAIREKYRQFEKTPQINLAYSVLKNTPQREDYLWLLENHKTLNTLFGLLVAGEGPREIKKEKEEISDIQETINALTKLFAERGIKIGKDKIPNTEETVNILSEIFEEEEDVIAEPFKKKKRRKSKKYRNQTTFDVFEGSG
jgi:curved DNA-binding protein CbpA